MSRILSTGGVGGGERSWRGMCMAGAGCAWQGELFGFIVEKYIMHETMLDRIWI